METLSPGGNFCLVVGVVEITVSIFAFRAPVMRNNRLGAMPSYMS